MSKIKFILLFSVVSFQLFPLFSGINCYAQRVLEREEYYEFDKATNTFLQPVISQVTWNGNTRTELDFKYNDEKKRSDTTGKDVSVCLNKNEQQPLENIFLKYNTGTHQFDSTKKVIHKYDATGTEIYSQDFVYDKSTKKWLTNFGKCEQDIVDANTYNWNYYEWSKENEQFVPGGRNVITKNKAGKILENITEKIAANNWAPYSRYVYAFRNDTIMVSSASEKWNDDKWYNESTTHYFYDNRNNCIKEVETVRKNDTLTVTTNTYNEHNDLVLGEELNKFYFSRIQHLWTYDTHSAKEEINTFSASLIQGKKPDEKDIHPTGKMIYFYKVK